MSRTRHVQKSHNHDLESRALNNGETWVQSFHEAIRLIEAAGVKNTSILDLVGNESYIVVDTGDSKDFLDYYGKEEVSLRVRA